MPKHKIVILSGDKVTQELELSDKHIWTKKFDTVEWSIKNEKTVSKIEAIYRKRTSPEIFSTPPYPVGKLWEGYIDLKPHFITTYEYNIKWYDADGGGPWTHDPKISIMPTIGGLLARIVGVIVAAIISFFAFKFLKKKKVF